MYNADCEDLILHCKEVLAAKVEAKQIFVEKFAEALQVDVQALFEEIDEINSEIIKDWLIDEESNSVDVKDTLTSLMDRLIVCRSLSQEYRAYQKEFKVTFGHLTLCRKKVSSVVSCRLTSLVTILLSAFYKR